MDRPQTPPPNASSSSQKIPLTPEQLKRIEINRLKAKARQRAYQESLEAGTSKNTNSKRPLRVIPDESHSPTAPTPANKKSNGDKNAPLKPDARLGRYLDYDLSKMVDSRGGFLIEERGGMDEEERRQLLRRERERMHQNLDPPMHIDPDRNPKCRECNSMDIDHVFKNIFGCLVCNKCKDAHPEKYALLTKTECKEDYLLTDPELRDQELLPHLLKANPHKATWNNMMLFLRYQVEEFAFKKWGSAEELDKEWEKRVEEKKKKKTKKFEEGLRELRRKTREGIYQKRKDEEHHHEFGGVEDSDGTSVQRCKECGFEIEVEEF